MADTLPKNPLPKCPSTSYCVRDARFFKVPADALFSNARAALGRMRTHHVHADRRAYRLHAVFTVGYFFKDDVHLSVIAHQDGSALYLRSASRVGRYDFGVNRRRMHRFFDLLAEQLRGTHRSNSEEEEG